MNYLEIKPEVREALANGKAVVALESTIIAHGMPYPKNVETALAVEDVIRKNGAVPVPVQTGRSAALHRVCTGMEKGHLRDPSMGFAPSGSKELCGTDRVISRSSGLLCLGGTGAQQHHQAIIADRRDHVSGRCHGTKMRFVDPGLFQE